MHGLGNDFIVIDAVSQKISLTPSKIRKLSDRRFGIGCDQVLFVEPPKHPNVDFSYRIFNANGEEVENCGNGARCFAVFVQQRNLCSKNTIRVETKGGQLVLQVRDDKHVTVDMGPPVLEPSQIPFSANEQRLNYDLQLSDRSVQINAISMGNPHAVTFVDDVSSYPVLTVGAEIEAHARFPSKVNAGFMEIISATEAKLRVFERGVGETLACGTGACAAMVAARLHDKLGPEAKIHLPGGTLELEWQGENQPVMMTGPAVSVFAGQILI
jgi:diaminopimelate epimerase